MLELLLCSMLTIFPDYLFRRYVQGKRIGQELTLFSVWFELRWGITACAVLTITLITMIFYFHPSTRMAVSYFRTIPVTSEGIGRVAEVYVGVRERVNAGDPIFKLDSSEQEAAVETARRRILEVDAQLEVAQFERVAAESRVQQVQSTLDSVSRELERQLELQRRDASAVAQQKIDVLQSETDEATAALAEAMAKLKTIETQISTLLPSQKASAEAALAEAQADLAKTTIYAGVDGTLEQFTLRPGDIVNPMMRPAGILVPREAGRTAIQAGFNQIEAQVLRVGMAAEATCVSRPFAIIPLVVTEVQDVIAAGQLRPSDQLVDPQSAIVPGSLTVYLEPMFEGGLDGIPPGTSCIANAYTNNHELLGREGIGTGEWVFLHVIDTVGLLHALILRMQAILLPVQTLVLSGH